MIFLVAQKCKPCDIYRKMCNGCGKECFSQKNAYKRAKHGFATTRLSRKVETLTIRLKNPFWTQ